MAMTIRLLRAGPGVAEGKARRRRARGSPASHASRPELGGRRLVEVVLVSDARKIRRNAGAAAPIVLRDLGEDAERPGHQSRGRRIIYRLAGVARHRRYARLAPLY